MNTSAKNQRLIFISYRRADADALAGRVRDRLLAELPDWDVFMDVASIEAGGNFKQVIDQKIGQASVSVSLIGPQWGGEGDVRIHDPADLVRYEVRSALARGLRVIPVLVNGARMPAVRELPADICGLTDLSAIEIRHTRFDDDFANLARAISGARAVGGERRRGGFVQAVVTATLAALGGLVAGFAGLAVHYEMTGKSISDRIGNDGATLILPACVILGSLIGVWHHARRSA